MSSPLNQAKATVVPPHEFVERVARELGFSRVGFAIVGDAKGIDHLRSWVERGFHADMSWMARGQAARANPRALLGRAQSVITLLTAYSTDAPVAAGSAEYVGSEGKVSRYAWGRDYHLVLGRRLRKLVRAIEGEFPGERAVAAVDFKPILEKEWAERAGLGWIGKHTNLITEDAGSWFFVSEVVTSLVIEQAKDVSPPNRCGKCVDCIKACPTGAIVAPYQVDARRCISYLTIELKGPIPRDLRPLVGEWIFGCDVCQDVCPWNRFAVPVTEPAFQWSPARFEGNLADFLDLDEGGFDERFRGSPVRRATRNGFLRNVCVALGNRARPEDAGPLTKALDDSSPLVRSHAAWALGRLGGVAAWSALTRRLESESVGEVREEIQEALDAASNSLKGTR